MIINNLKPKLAIASAGFDNRYGHPSQEVINRLKALHIPLKSTVERGTLSFIWKITRWFYTTDVLSGSGCVELSKASALSLFTVFIASKGSIL